MGHLESKVVAATAASVAPVPLVALVIWLLAQANVDINETAAAGIILVLTPLVVFIGGYFKRSRTSTVSDAYVRPMREDSPEPSLRRLDDPPPGTTPEDRPPSP